MKKLASIFMTLTILLTGYCQELPKNNEKILKFPQKKQFVNELAASRLLKLTTTNIVAAAQM